MDEVTFLGYLVTAVITLGGFVGVVVKFTQPINELRVVIQKLNDNIDTIREVNEQQNKRIEKHGKQIDDLNHRVGKIEGKIELNHE